MFQRRPEHGDPEPVEVTEDGFLAAGQVPHRVRVVDPEQEVDRLRAD